MKNLINTANKKYSFRTIITVTALVLLVAVIFFVIGFVSAVFLPRFACEETPASSSALKGNDVKATDTPSTPTKKDEVAKENPSQEKLPESTTTNPTTTTTKTTSYATTIAGPKISITFTVENVVTKDDHVFRATIKFNTTKRPFIDIMNEIQQLDSRFRFTSKKHVDFGHFVTHVQDIQPKPEAKMYWAFLRREASADCSMPLGVSSYVPSDGEHLVLSLQKFTFQLKQCNAFTKPVPTPATIIDITSGIAENDTISMKYTLENTISDEDNNFDVTATVNTPAKFFYEIMVDVMKKDERFSFETTESESFGHYVTSMRNLPANHTASVYWAFLRREVDEDCAMAIGISQYLPSDGEHLVMSFQTYSAKFKTCESLIKPVP